MRISLKEYEPVCTRDLYDYLKYISGQSGRIKTLECGMLHWGDNKDKYIWSSVFPGDFVYYEVSDYRKSSQIKLEKEIREELKIYFDDPKHRDYEMKGIATKEKPFKVFLAGTDDTSYSAVFGNKDDAFLALGKLEEDCSSEKLHELFVFTN